MKVLLINVVCGTGSTGRICTELAEDYKKQGADVHIAYGRGNAPEKYKDISYRIGTDLDNKIHGLCTRLFDAHGLFSVSATKRFLKWADEYDPDILWLHNIHGYYINYELLFDWIRSRQKIRKNQNRNPMEIKWTLHDCWAFTGHCSYFSYVGCDKWKTNCHDCPQKDKYPASVLFDRSERNYIRKKKSFTGIDGVKLIAPSNWLKGLIEKSFLKDYPVEVRYNSVDRDVFKPVVSDFRKKYTIDSTVKIILGVASVWSERKGLDDFITLAKVLEEKCNNTYKIVLVGLDSKQRKCVPSNILCMQSIDNIFGLTKVYSSADVFFNPSKEETFGLTTLEAICCGTKAVVYKETACEEVVGVAEELIRKAGPEDEKVIKAAQSSFAVSNIDELIDLL